MEKTTCEPRLMKKSQVLTQRCDLHSWVVYGQKPFDGRVEVEPDEI